MYKTGCPNGSNKPCWCSKCEVGYTLNTVTNERELAKVSCTGGSDCSGRFGCRKDPECGEYSDSKCTLTGKVCVTRRVLETACIDDSECDEKRGFGCLIGDRGDGRCIKYQSP